ncbi:uncharacterized protein CMU_031520 [Cryptosporidium muris RN66]|uniref:Uncharacterized protein n=1 Tax=Cryptosporidium muris (strain RN66) TaxID=441375 RepID=B6AIH0_CRYMR|nr:uncharacterized protein CMU_031520 [Cryptosporidium muris RN66]EEA08011.1 hypothetical protein, conserved [Cryptosporidium muris RN66]|eukprot:XP_002142360.1 hypothetical protein [Cryptosporidium muris RN66]
MEHDYVRRPVVLQKMQLEAKRLFTFDKRKNYNEERKSDLKYFKHKNSLRMSECQFKQHIIFPPHPKKVILPIIENNIMLLAGIGLSLLNTDIVSINKNLLDIISLRSFTSIIIIPFILLEIYLLKSEITGYLVGSYSYSRLLCDNSKIIKLLIFWMSISSIAFILQVFMESLIQKEFIFLCQPFLPLSTLFILLIIVFLLREKEYTKISSQNITNELKQPNEEYNVLDKINMEILNLRNDYKTTHLVNPVSFQQFTSLILCFLATFMLTPIHAILEILLENKLSKSTYLSMIPLLIIPVIHDILFHLMCNKIYKEIFQFYNDNVRLTNEVKSVDLSKKLCHAYIHLFMTFGQVLIVFPCFILFRILLQNNIGVNINNLFLVISSTFDLGIKETTAIIFSTIAIIGFYQRCKINTTEAYGIFGLVSMKTLQMVLEICIRSENITISRILLSLSIVIFSVGLLRIQYIVSFFKIIYFYFKWFLDNNKVKGDISYQRIIFRNQICDQSKVNQSSSTFTRSVASTFKNYENCTIAEDIPLFSDEDSKLKSENLLEYNSFNLNNLKSKKAIAYDKEKEYLNDEKVHLEVPKMAAKIVILATNCKQ